MARIDAFLRLMIEQKASDLHIIAGGEPILRVYGDLIPIQYRQVTTDECLNLVNEILPDRLKSDFQEFSDVDFAYQLADKARFRVNMFRHNLGVGATFRLIPMEIPTLSNLNLPEQISQFAEFRQGLVLVTGITGSGKSTTLASLVNIINEKYQRHIVTIEDPIEFVHRRNQCLISQREIGVHSPDFSTAIRNSARSSADIIMIGELRDPETISEALTAAETGTLVLGTLHTNSCASAISRLIDVFPGDRQQHIQSLLSVALKGIVSQQLLRQKNIRGRLPVAEVLFGSPALSYMIREKKIHQISAYLETAEQERNLSWDNCLSSLVEQDLISLESAVKLARDPGRFQQIPV